MGTRWTLAVVLALTLGLGVACGDETDGDDGSGGTGAPEGRAGSAERVATG